MLCGYTAVSIEGDDNSITDIRSHKGLLFRLCRISAQIEWPLWSAATVLCGVVKRLSPSVNTGLIGALQGANRAARQSFDFRAFPALQSILCFRV
jgi:hypothetical protein